MPSHDPLSPPSAVAPVTPAEADRKDSSAAADNASPPGADRKDSPAAPDKKPPDRSLGPPLPQWHQCPLRKLIGKTRQRQLTTPRPRELTGKTRQRHRTRSRPRSPRMLTPWRPLSADITVLPSTFSACIRSRWRGNRGWLSAPSNRRRWKSP